MSTALRCSEAGAATGLGLVFADMRRSLLEAPRRRRIRDKESRAVRFLAFAARGFLVGALILAQLVVWFAGWLVLLATLRGKPRRQAWFAGRLRALIRGLGATYVKVGQIMSTRPDLLPPHVIRALETLQDDVGAFPYRHVERAFRGDFGRAPEEVFASFEREPVASASIAQVHRAVLANGREVAVKVRRPR